MKQYVDEKGNRRVQYKRVRAFVPHCPVCGEELMGNNSIASPYRCKCGIWKTVSYDQPFLYRIEKI